MILNLILNNNYKNHFEPRYGLFPTICAPKVAKDVALRTHYN